MHLTRILQNTALSIILILTLIWFSPLSHARGGISHTDIESTRHIEELPSEIRNALGRWQSARGTPLKNETLVRPLPRRSRCCVSG